MKTPIVFAVLVTLAACNGAKTEQDSGDVAKVAEVDPNADAGFEAVAPGNYEVVHADGKIDHLEVLPGMTWAMVYADGHAAGGTIFAQAGKNCFVTEGVDGHQCFSGSPPAADGSIQVTGDDGEIATVRPAKPADNSSNG
jgi:hypothetical protein